MMTFHIGLTVSLTEQHIEHTPTSMPYTVEVLIAEEHLSYWSNQVPEKGDYIRYYSAKQDEQIDLTVTSRVWVLSGNTGGPRGEHDVEIYAKASL